MNKLFIFLLLGFLLFLSLGYFCVYKILAPAIELDIKNKVQDSLARNDLGSIQVATNGRDISLKGVVSSEKLKAKAQRVAAIDGYNAIDNQIVVTKKSLNPKTIVDPYAVTLRLKEDQSIVLSGSVPDTQTKNKLLSLANSRYGKPHVTDDLSIKGNAPISWQETLVVALNSFSNLKQGQVTILNNMFELGGVTDSEASRQQVGEYLESNLPKNYTGSLDIAIMLNNESKAEAKAKTTDEAKVSESGVTDNCQKNFKALLSNNKIHFKTGRAVIAKESFKLLDELVLVAMGCTTQIMTVEGYTDSRGTERNNKKLSQQRAEAVVNYFQQKGVATNNLKAKGYGEEKPVATNKTPEGRALNRRIEFTVEEEK